MRPRLEASASSPDAVASVPCQASPADAVEGCRRLLAELDSPMGDAGRAKEACDRLRAARQSWRDPSVSALFPGVAEAAARRAGSVAATAVSLVLEAVREVPEPWPILRPLLGAAPWALGALDAALGAAREGRFRADDATLEALALLSSAAGSPLATPAALERIARLLDAGLPRGTGEEEDARRLEELLCGPAGPVRRLAARLLDAVSRPSPLLVRRLLGEEGADFLGPYLDYTCATHADLADLAGEPGTSPACLPSLRATAARHGEPMVRDLIAAFGWRRLNAGVALFPFVGVRWEGSFPLLMTPAEARLLDGDPRAERALERWIAVAHGGSPRRAGGAAEGDPVARFRGLNLLHADALGDLLDLAPLDPAKARRILARLGRIVEEFCALFGGKEPDECRVVADVHRGLVERIAPGLEATPDGRPLPADATRLVQLFEDPRSAGEIRTLHGLKRYLHQKGLALGFRLAEMGRGTDRTVDFAVVEAGRPGPVSRVVEYVDFEEEASAAGPAGIPWPIWVAVDGFSRQLLFGPLRLPKVKAFCYGNEVHYYLAYRNHPLFLRVDFAPPLRGGMLDLEYYGVSKHELDSHPNPSLDGVGRFFRRLDVDVSIESTRIHARYDKERAADLSDLCEKVEALFRLAPYLMDIDWTIGDLALDAAAKARVSEAWADFFALWGVLPAAQLLTPDRVGIVAAVEAGPSGPLEVRWDGEGPYRDRFGPAPGPSLRKALRDALAARGLGDAGPPEEGAAAQLELERELLRPLREGVARGEWFETPGGLAPAPPELFQRRHETELFAGLLVEGGAKVAAAAGVGLVAAALERHLRFETTGSVNGYEVQRASLPLRGESIALFALRDGGDVLRLAFLTLDGPPHRRRASTSDPWRESPLLDAELLAARLRRNNFPVSPAGALDPGETEALRLSFFSPNPNEEASRLPGERLLAGIPAAPGAASGRACLGTEGRSAEEVDGAVLVTATLRPEDGPLLFRAAAVVTTGGGVLSHAGLLAMQFGKPALVTGGRWDSLPGGAPAALCRRTDFDEAVTLSVPFRVVERRARREAEETIRDGDLLVVDADAGLLRLLGQDHDALALHDGLRQLAASARALESADDDGEILTLRGSRLRARHQLERLFDRLEDPALARHAARELLSGTAARSGDDPTSLLVRLLRSPSVGTPARAACRQVAADLERRRAARSAEAARAIPASDDPLEILFLRREARRLEQRAAAVAASLAATGGDPPAATAARSSAWPDLDRRSRSRLSELRSRLAADLDGAGPLLRHRLALLGRLDLVLATPAEATAPLRARALRLEEADARVRTALARRRVLGAADGGVELRPLVGSKAASLAEVARVAAWASVPVRAPAWFAVTDLAFRETLASAAPQAAALAGAGAGATLREAIDRLLADGSKSPEARSALIRRAWEVTPLPPGLAEEVAATYSRLGTGGEEPFVAIRSSALEEDTETAARAGEFDTFLFVRGVPGILDRLRLAWAGLWTPRALRHREAMGLRDDAAGGGVLVQVMVDARASGVLHTVNVAAGRPREMLVNAGLGLGEGVVSGLVAADQITVEKDEALAGDAIHVRYLTRDKRQRVVFDAKAGSGTVCVETLYHQRLRPALEYVELCDLVHAAARLEAALGLPLDVEFAVDPSGLHLLQVRPVPAALAAWSEAAGPIPP